MTPQEVRVGDRLEDSNGQVGTVKEIGTDSWLMDDGFSLGFCALKHGARVLPRQAYEAPKLTAIGKVDDTELQALREERDAAELGWWRTQFSTRFPENHLPEPGTALLGRRFHLVEDSVPVLPEKPSSPSFHVGIDLGGKDTIALTLVQDGKILSYAHVDVMEIIDREIRKLAGIFCAPIHILPRLPCVGDCGETTEQRPGEITWMCHGCSTKPRPETLAPVQAQTPVTDNAVPCCRIGGAKGLDGLPCPLHPPAREPFVPEHDTFGFLKP